MVTTIDMLVDNIGLLCTPLSDSAKPLRGSDMHNGVKSISQAAVAISQGKIIAAGPRNSVRGSTNCDSGTRIVDAQGKVVVPGLVDPHTHLIFSGNRANEFIMRCQGRTYAEIAQAGGGIVASMRATREASLDELVRLGGERLKRMAASGTTTCEVKTGYGLDRDSELRMLEAILVLANQQPVELIPTVMPAHAFPPGRPRDEYVQEIISEILPRAAELLRKYGKLETAFNDVFCDEGYFTLEQTKEILQAGLKLGLKPKVHSDEFASLGATAMAVEMNAASADHLLSVTEEDIKRLAGGSTIAVLLPGTSFFLNLSSHAPARRLIEAGAAVALGSDFNPGSCHIFSLPFIWGLACLHLKMTPEEALTALTLNSSVALHQAHRLGQIREGYDADLLVLDVSNLAEVPYNLASNPVACTIKGGAVIEQSVQAQLLPA